jgi:3'-phosphoadenosine 5'-phosphosulfate sulfotransferase (PAPS reductase)/FAD synthetase
MNSPRDPYAISGPTCISFSGGRTSAYMLRKILDRYGGTLPPETHVLFANTGKEHPGTLDFVARCEQDWSVPITWLEFDGTHGYREVNYSTASRKGEPFDLLIKKKTALPNWRKRFCTSMLKVERLHAYMSSRYEAWTDMVGLRADEPDRVHRRGGGTDAYVSVYPLFVGNVTKDKVMSFWRSNSFDLQIPVGAGNCDLCFMKGVSVLRPLLSQYPSLADWWIQHEHSMGRTWTSRHTYLQLRQQAFVPASRLAAGKQTTEIEDSVSCHCTD